MTLSESPNDDIARIVGSLRAKGVQLWSDNGNLRYRAGRGVLSEIDLAQLRASREHLVALLEQRNRPQHVPLTFTQLQHRHLYHLATQPAIRQIASAIRLQGRLDIGALDRSIAEIVRRQEALRTRITVCDGLPMQEVLESNSWSLHVTDLAGIPPCDQETAVKLQIDDHILEPIDITRGPLFGIRLLQLSAAEHVLIVAMEHSISDGFSMNLFLRDLFTAYAQARQNRPFLLPPIAVTFSQYARQQKAAHPQWVREHGSYWHEYLTGAGRLRFPFRKGEDTEEIRGWGTVPILIDKQLKSQLTEWARMARTTLPLAVFTAYIALVLRWCDACDMTARYVIDGRTARGTENTIGFFASVLYLRIGLQPTDTFLDLLKRVTNEYCNAWRHVDHCFLESLVPRPEFTRGTAFNWLPGGTGLALRDPYDSPMELSCIPIQFEHPLRRINTLDNEPVILLNELEEEVAGSISYPLSQFAAPVMARFARNLLLVLDILRATPSKVIEDIELC